MEKNVIFNLLKNEEFYLEEAKSWFANADKFSKGMEGKGKKATDCQLLKCETIEEVKEAIDKKFADGGLEGLLRRALRKIQIKDSDKVKIWEELTENAEVFLELARLEEQQKALKAKLKSH